jgi:hypothetical protein
MAKTTRTLWLHASQLSAVALAAAAFIYCTVVLFGGVAYAISVALFKQAKKDRPTAP